MPTPPDLITLEPIEKLGKYMLYDNTMSDPVGLCLRPVPRPDDGLHVGARIDRQFERRGRSPGSCPAGSAIARPYELRLRRVQPGGPLLRHRSMAVWVGGNFWDGRAFDTSVQAQGPPINPNEMNNTPVGTAPNQYPPLLVKKLQSRPYTPLIKQIYGKDVFTKYTPRQIFEIWGEAIAAFEASGDICQFSSKYDASQYGVPAQKHVQALRIRGAREAVVLRPGPMLRLPLVGGPPGRPDRDGGEGHLHDVLLRQHRRPQESRQSLLRG